MQGQKEADRRWDVQIRSRYHYRRQTRLHKPVRIPHHKGRASLPAFTRHKALITSGNEFIADSSAATLLHLVGEDQEQQACNLLSRRGVKASINFATTAVRDLTLRYLGRQKLAASLNLWTGGNAYAGTMSTVKYNKNKEWRRKCPVHAHLCR